MYNGVNPRERCERKELPKIARMGSGRDLLSEKRKVGKTEFLGAVGLKKGYLIPELMTAERIGFLKVGKKTETGEGVFA